MNTSKSLNGILYGFAEECGVINKDISEARAAIVEAIDRLIGQDEPTTVALRPQDQLEGVARGIIVGRNELRAELRQAIKEWQ